MGGGVASQESRVVTKAVSEKPEKLSLSDQLNQEVLKRYERGGLSVHCSMAPVQTQAVESLSAGSGEGDYYFTGNSQIPPGALLASVSTLDLIRARADNTE